MVDLYERLSKYTDKEYAKFIASLSPTVDPSLFLGVRVPELRAFAKEFMKTSECEEFLHSLPHKYYDENLLHSIILCHAKDINKLYNDLEEFLPYIDNWAACDTLKPNVFKKHKEDLINNINKWVDSSLTYTIRFGVSILMGYFLDDDYRLEYLEIPARIKSEEYYVRMMVAWFYATALAKQWNDAIVYLENKRLDKWTHNKAIQKAIESFRITEEQKNYLRTLKINEKLI